MGADEPQTRLLARGGKNGEVMLAGRRSKSRARRWITRLVLLVVLVALLPFVLTLVYRLPGVMPVSTLMLADTVLGDGYERDWTRLENISPNLVHAVMMSEDGRFCSHEGIDWPALHGEIEDALSGEKVRGASTITMQTVKNLFLWPGRSFVRKGIEVPLALYFDAVIAKPRIMEIYLNIAEWAPGIYGAEAAARHHFGRSAAALTPRQAALLAVTLPNPHARNPAEPSQSLAELAGLIERRAAQAGAYVGCLR